MIMSTKMNKINGTKNPQNSKPTTKSNSNDKVRATTKSAGITAQNGKPKEKIVQDESDTQEDMEVTPTNIKRTATAASLSDEESTSKKKAPKPPKTPKEPITDNEKGKEKLKPKALQVSAMTREHRGRILQVLQKNGALAAVTSLEVLMEAIAELTTHCAYLEGKNDLLKEQLKEKQQMNEIVRNTIIEKQAEPKSYASAVQKLVSPVAMSKKSNIQKTSPTILLKPKDNELTDMNKAKEILAKSFNPQREKVRVRSIRRARNGLIVETETMEDLAKLQSSPQIGKNFECEALKKRLPKVVIYDVPHDMDGDALTAAVFEQNPGLCADVDSFKGQFVPKFRTGRRDDRASSFVVEVSAGLRNKLLVAKRVYVGWLSCKVHDFILVTRCFKCQGYGHIAKHCTREDTVCSHCAEEGHKETACPSKKHKPKCSNCCRAKKPSSHNALDKACPLYKQAFEKLINSTDYGV